MGYERKPNADRLPVSQRIDQRMPNPKRRTMRATDWAIRGELFLNCSCTVFCPCVVSLGQHAPTEGSCKAWMAIAIDEGHYENHDLTGINVGLMVEIPGKMAEGDWRVAVYIDERATPGAYNGLLKILSGEAGGTTGLFTLLVSTIIGHEREKVDIIRDGKKRGLYIGRKIQGEIEMIDGSSPEHPVMVSNTRYWMGPDVIVAKAGKSKVRDYGRIWDLSGKSGEICAIDWKGGKG